MQNKEVGVFITAKKDGAYTKIKSVDFGSGEAKKLTARVGTTHNKGVFMEVRVDAKDGQLLATVKIPLTGGNDRWALITADLPKISGVHDLYFVFHGKYDTDIIFFVYWKLSK